MDSTQTLPIKHYQKPAIQYIQTIHSVIDSVVRSYPDRVALQIRKKQFTFRQLVDNVAQMVSYLKSQGITSNTTVVLLFDNTPGCVVCFLALAWLNAQVIPLESQSFASYTIETILRDIPFTAVIGEYLAISRFNQKFNYVNCTLIGVGEDIFQEPDASIDLTKNIPKFYDNVFLYHYTSGSTGKPKAALHSQANLIKGGLIYKYTYQIQPEDNVFTTIPLSHSFGMVAGLFATLVSGAKLILGEKFSPHKIIEIVSEGKVTVLLAVPFIYDLLTRCALNEIPDVSSLRICLSSGAPLTHNVAEKFYARYHRSIYQVYGSTEVGVITAQWPRTKKWPDGSIGCPLQDVVVKIVDENGEDLPPNKIGTLLVKTSTMFAGYHNNIDATAKMFQGDWYITGDLARQDEEGHLYLCGRKDTFINVGGKKVNPIEVEEVLLAHPMVKEAVVYGSKRMDTEEDVRADVVLQGKISMTELLQFCKERLASYKIPYQINVVDMIPKTGMGKFRRGK